MSHRVPFWSDKDKTRTLPTILPDLRWRARSGRNARDGVQRDARSAAAREDEHRTES